MVEGVGLFALLRHHRCLHLQMAPVFRRHGRGPRLRRLRRHERRWLRRYLRTWKQRDDIAGRVALHLPALHEAGREDQVRELGARSALLRERLRGGRRPIPRRPQLELSERHHSGPQRRCVLLGPDLRLLAEAEAGARLCVLERRDRRTPGPAVPGRALRARRMSSQCDDHRRQGAGCKGVYRVRKGKVELVTKELDRPNGLAISNDGRFLWVCNNAKEGPSWSAFFLSDALPLVRSFVLDSRSLGQDLTPGPGRPGASDGFRVDVEGRIWSTIPGGIAVIHPTRNTVLAEVRFKTNTSNVEFGDNGDVFVTGVGHLWRLRRQ
mmetsp:Transcript_58192/g.188345  ORF Transcript_58192/g.188345 Transcript_58192/m.188345 type:complete len:323 (+) Transcript_58192:292-1260(+)